MFADVGEKSVMMIAKFFFSEKLTWNVFIGSMICFFWDRWGEMLARAYWLELGFAIKPENVYEIGMFLQFIIYN